MGRTRNVCGVGCESKKSAPPFLCYEDADPPSDIDYGIIGTDMKRTGHWVLFKYVGREIRTLSKPFKTREAAERARAKLPKKEQRSVGVGVIRSNQ